jgi:hypothetical protein
MEGTKIGGSGSVLPTPGNWFKLAKLSMSLSWDTLNIRISPTVPFLDPTLQKTTTQIVYDQIEGLKPNLSELCRTTYTTTVELKLT